MAKNAKIVAGGVDDALLQEIVLAPEGYKFVSAVASQPMTAHVPPLVEVNQAMVDPTDPSKFATRATPEATAYLAASVTDAANPATLPAGAPVKSAYAIITNAELPASKRRGGHSHGAPAKYPFAELPVHGSFFSANTEHKKNDAVKALGSTVSAQNNKYAEATGETKTVTRAVRDPKTHKAVLNTDGTKQTETVNLPKKKYARKFTIRPVEAGKIYGGWTAPADGALIARTI